MPNDHHSLTATEALAKFRSSRLKPENYVASCLERIRERDTEINAWVTVDYEGSMQVANAASRCLDEGILPGIPVGFKDVIDTEDLPTTYGSAKYRSHLPLEDAACVGLTKQAGGLCIGKTATTEFAARMPSRTRNPRNSSYSPGGSSSGSAAAVADCMVPLAVGTQTVGSTIRPAAYCGIFGYKPTYQLLSFCGVRHLSESFDTLGLFARSLDDMRLFKAALLQEPIDTLAYEKSPRLAFCKTPYWNSVDPVYQNKLESLIDLLKSKDLHIEEIYLDERHSRTESIMWDVIFYEMRQNNVKFRPDDPAISLWFRSAIKSARNITFSQHLANLSELNHLNAEAARVIEPFDAVLTMSALGEAPQGISDTGSPVAQAIWHALKLPSLTIPVLSGAKGMPLGLQIVGRQYNDDDLLRIGELIYRHST